MPVKVNLIPEKFKTQGSLYKAYKIFGMLSIIGTIVFFVSFLVMIFIIILNDNRIKVLTTKQNQLTKQIEGLNEEEVKYSFLKTKSTQVKEIAETSEAQYKAFYDLLTSQSGNVQIPQADLNAAKVEFQMFSGSLTGLIGFFDTLIEEDIYKDVSVGGLSYTKDSGFSAEINFSY